MRGVAYAVVLDGTNEVSLQLDAMGALEVIPGDDTVTVSFRLGPSSDLVALRNGRSYASPPGVMVDRVVLKLRGASATTATVIAWYP